MYVNPSIIPAPSQHRPIPSRSTNHEPYGANGASWQCGTRRAGAESKSITAPYPIG